MAYAQKVTHSLVHGIRDVCGRMRPPPHVPVLRDLLAYQKKWGLDKTQRILSIGPGAGDNDVAVLPAFPRCRHYIGVDKDQPSAETLTGNIDRHYPDIKAEIHARDIRDFEGPSEQVDAIFAFNVLDEIEKPIEVLQKTTDWLKPGGLLFNFHGNEKNSWAFPVVSQLYPASKNSSYLHANLKTDLKTLDHMELIDEFHYDYTIDFRHKSEQLAWWFLHRPCSDKEVDEIFESFRSLDPSCVFPVDRPWRCTPRRRPLHRTSENSRLAESDLVIAIDRNVKILVTFLSTGS